MPRQRRPQRLRLGCGTRRSNRFWWRRGGLRKWRHRRRNWLGCDRRRNWLGRWQGRLRWRFFRGGRRRRLGRWRWFGGGRLRLGRRSGGCYRLLEHQLNRRGIRRWRWQRRRYSHEQGCNRGGVHQHRRQSPYGAPARMGGSRRTNFLRRIDMQGRPGIRRTSRTTPFWNAITCHHGRLSSSRASFGKRRLPFPLSSKSGTIVR